MPGWVRVGCMGLLDVFACETKCGQNTRKRQFFQVAPTEVALMATLLTSSIMWEVVRRRRRKRRPQTFRSSSSGSRPEDSILQSASQQEGRAAYVGTCGTMPRTGTPSSIELGAWVQGRCDSGFWTGLGWFRVGFLGVGSRSLDEGSWVSRWIRTNVL